MFVDDLLHCFWATESDKPYKSEHGATFAGILLLEKDYKSQRYVFILLLQFAIHLEKIYEWKTTPFKNIAQVTIVSHT